MTFPKDFATSSIMRMMIAALGAAALTACVDGILGNKPESTLSTGDARAFALSAYKSTLAPNQTTLIRALVGSGEEVQTNDVAWASTGGTLSDTTVRGHAFKVFRGLSAGKYGIVGRHLKRNVADTAWVTVVVSSQPAVSLVLSPRQDTVVTGGQVQFVAYGRTSAGDSIPVATVLSGSGGTINGDYYTAGDVAGTYRVISTLYGGTIADSCNVVIAAAAAPSAATSSPPPPATTGANSPELPRAYLDTHYPVQAGRTLRVAASGNLQAAIDSARRGDRILLSADAQYTGNFILPAKSGTGVVTIETETVLPPEGVRVRPSTAVHFAKLVSTGGTVIQAGDGADGYRLTGIEVTSTASSVTSLIYWGDPTGANKDSTRIARNLTLDRVYVHGTPTTTVRRCLSLNSRASAVVDSWMSDCHEKGADSQAIVGWDGPGPFKIVNNHLEGAGENVMFGGADPVLVGLVPSDIEFRRNHVIKPMEWFTSARWTVKNLLETKNVRRMLIEGNVFENNWTDGQSGMGIVFKSSNQNGQCPWCVTSDVIFRLNRVVNSAGGISISAGEAYNGGSFVPLRRVQVTQIAFEQMSLLPGAHRLLQMLSDMVDVEVSRTTALDPTDALVMFDGPPGVRSRMTDNLWAHGLYGVFGSNVGEGTPAVTTYMPGGTFSGNVIVGAGCGIYPAGTSCPGTPNGVTAGADIAAVAAATAGVVVAP